MKVTKETVEQWMFDFYEGTLSEEQKGMLLDFLHQHPEHQQDFSLWAQTHALKSDPIPVPEDLLDGVLLNPKMPWAHGKLLLGITGALSTLALVLWWWGNSSSPSVLSPSPAKVSQFRQVVKKEARNDLKKMGRSATLSLSADSAVSLPAKTKADTLQKTVAISSSDALHTQESEVPREQETLPLASVDTLVKTPPVPKESEALEKNEAESGAKRRPKKRLPLNLKPQDTFKPANPNF